MRLRLRLGIECFELDLVEQMSRNGKDFHAYVNRQQADPDRIHALKDTNNNLCFRMVVVPDLTRAAEQGRLGGEARSYAVAYLSLAVPVSVLVAVFASRSPIC